MILSRIIFSFFFFFIAPIATSSARAVQAPVFKFYQNTNSPKIGQSFQVLAKSDYGQVNQQELIPEFAFNGVPVAMVQTSPSLWVVNLGVLHLVKRANEVTADIYVRNARDAKRLRASIKQINLEIAAIDSALGTETDPQKIADLEARKALKLAQREQLESEFAALKTFLKSETYTFASSADPANPNYPIANSVSPALGPVSGGTAIGIVGQRFPVGEELPVVLVGGVACSVSSNSETSVSAITPADLSVGLNDVEVIFPGSPAKNSLLLNAFEVTNP